MIKLTKAQEKVCKCKIPDMVWEMRGNFCDRCGGRVKRTANKLNKAQEKRRTRNKIEAVIIHAYRLGRGNVELPQKLNEYIGQLESILASELALQKKEIEKFVKVHITHDGKGCVEEILDRLKSIK